MGKHEWIAIKEWGLIDRCDKCKSRRYRRPGRKTQYWDGQLNQDVNKSPKCLNAPASDKAAE